MATSVSRRPTSTLENVGTLALFLCTVFFLLAYGQQIAAMPFVHDMGETSKQLVLTPPNPGTGLRIEKATVREVDWAAQSNSATSMGGPNSQQKPQVAFQLRK